jgi:hypothetical protein
VEFYPNDAVFDAIAAAMKSSSKTYELFKTARLFLEKPERFAMIVRKNEGHSDRNIYLTTDDGFVFETENEAVTHILDNYVERYFDIDDREIPPPAGNFPCLHKCGITGIVLGPPNYHKYQKTSLDHHEKFLSHIPFEKFRAKIEKITDPEEIEKWRLQASKMRIFVPKKNGGAAKIELNSKEEAKKYFVENLRNGAITTYVSVRVSGETFSKMPRTLLSKSLFVLIEREKSFPLGFSNNLRGRLRRGGFAIYKTGGKSGVSYISGIKRKFRIVGDAFAEDIQRIISCIDASPKISMASLRLKCLQKPAGSDPSAGDSSSEAGDSIQSAENFYPSAENSGSVCGGDASESSAETHPPSGKNPTVKSAKSPKIGTENSANQAEDAFLRNLHWLIREGYVAEFEDGTLLATEIMRPQRRAIKSNGGGEGAPANTNYNRLREDKECDRQSEAEVESSGSLEADAESDGSSEAKSDGSSQLTGDADAFDGGEAKLIH